MNKHVAVAGTGYVGLSLAVLLSQHNKVTAVDLVKEKVDKINEKESPIVDSYISDYLKNKRLNLVATTDGNEAYKNADYIIISTPTNYDENTEFFDTSSVEAVIKLALSVGTNACFVIKSTVPVGFTNKIKEKYGIKKIIFSPEFLREGKALYDNLYPSRIVVGADPKDEGCSKCQREFADLLKEGAEKKDIPVLFTNYTEAEAVKLFSNTYLAMRVAFFNELDTYAEIKGLNTKEIIDGVCLDPRIGQGYNNPSFGYGGYCLPKDTKQLKANYQGVPEDIITAVVNANDTRKKFIAQEILKKNPKVVGIYRLTMKKGSDNFRSSSIQGVISYILSFNPSQEIIVFEPTIGKKAWNGFKVINDLDLFKRESSVIIANRASKDLDDSKEKIFTRDVYSIE